MNKFEKVSKPKQDSKKRSEISPAGRMGTRINKMVSDLFQANDSECGIVPVHFTQRLDEESIGRKENRSSNK